MPATQAKRDPQQEKEVLDWMEELLGEKIDRSEPYEKPSAIMAKIVTKGSGFALMENIQRFQVAAKKYGLPEDEVFQTVDLFEARNIPSVTKCIYALGRMTQKHPEYTGPQLGPKMSEENKREFTQEQLEAGKHIINTVQMGYAGGASQAGINIGKQRGVND